MLNYVQMTNNSKTLSRNEFTEEGKMRKIHILVGPVLTFALAACASGSVDKTSAAPTSSTAKNHNASTGKWISSAQMKWHPGHYGMSPATYSPALVRNIRSDWAAILKSDSRFVGVNAFYSWYNLEPNKQGAYDFAPIDNDIAWLNANFPGKKLMIEIWTRDFSRKNALPAVPQDPSDQNVKIPDYILTGAFDGSGGAPGATWNSNGRIAAFWSPPVLARLQALDAALAARYERNPTVELIKYDEYAPPPPAPDAPKLGWSVANMTNAWKAFYKSVAANWPTTNKALLANWPNNLSGSPDTGIIQFAKSIHVGVGGPDVLLPKTQDGPGETWGEMLLYGAGGTFGTTDHRGSVPIVYEVENPAWRMNARDIEEYAYTSLHVTHLAWLYNPLNMGTESWAVGAGTTPWRFASKKNLKGHPGVLDTLIENNFRIHNKCPTAYTGGCATN
jgi:hypothetical protein